MHRAGVIILKYWALAITVLLGIIVCAALSVPLLTYLGLNEIAKPIFYSLHLICAQIPSHSFYILGHQLGMCARNMGIYGSMFIGGLVFVFSKKRLPGIPWWVWVLMILPMAYDGLTQMFGLRESTWELRVLTGALFGFGNMWFALPLIQRTVTQMMDNPPPAYNAYPVQLAPQAVPMQTVPVQTPVLADQPDPLTPLPTMDTLIPTSQPDSASAAEDTSQADSTSSVVPET